MSSNAEKEKAVRLHNQARREAPGARRPDLVWSETLAKYASDYARVLATKGVFQHDSVNLKKLDQGENIFWYSATTGTWKQACECWIAEKAFYDGEAIGEGKPRTKKTQIGHYTQIIWPETTKFGMGTYAVQPGDRRFRGKGTYVVARYAPVGNYLGEHPWRKSPGNKDGSYKEEKRIKKLEAAHDPTSSNTKKKQVPAHRPSHR